MKRGCNFCRENEDIDLVKARKHSRGLQLPFRLKGHMVNDVWCNSEAQYEYIQLISSLLPLKNAI